MRLFSAPQETASRNHTGSSTGDSRSNAAFDRFTSGGDGSEGGDHDDRGRDSGAGGRSAAHSEGEGASSVGGGTDVGETAQSAYGYEFDPAADEDLEAWAQSLGQWPLVPDPPPPSRSAARSSFLGRETALREKGTSVPAGGPAAPPSPSNPLSRLLDLEALWLTLRKLTADSDGDEAPPLPAADAGAVPEIAAATEVEQKAEPAEAAAANEAAPARYDDGILVPADPTLLDGLARILSAERIVLQAGSLFRVFERDREEASALANETADAGAGAVVATGEEAAPSPPSASSIGPLELPSASSALLSSSSSPPDPAPFRSALSQLEGFVTDASALLRSPSVIMDVVVQASQVLQELAVQNATQVLKAATRVLQSEELQPLEPQELGGGAEAGAAVAATDDDGRDLGIALVKKEDAERRIQDALAFSAKLVSVADAVLRQGYVGTTKVLKTVAATTAASANRTATAAAVAPTSRALFADFATAREIGADDDGDGAARVPPPVAKAAEMGSLAGAIYEQTVPRTHALRHAIVARGVTADVAWMVTDALAADESFVAGPRSGPRDLQSPANATGTAGRGPFLVRTVTIRGFDASDEAVDREGLLLRVCTASPEPVKLRRGDVVELHGGMWATAREVYRDVKDYVSWTAPDHKVVLTGHSIGGSIANLVLLLMTLDLGPDYVKSKILRVYSYGSPPVARLKLLPEEEMHRQARDRRFRASYRCDVLEAFDLPGTLVEGYVQPWDPIVRLFSEIDPLYPLLGDVGADGVTPWASGPPRTLRPITKAIMEAWEGWPRFRDALGATGNQTYRSIGVQNILVPEPTRYLADRFVGVNVQVPPVSSLVRISSRELLPALQLVFPLDVFEISFVPQAIRSFVHHFYPAYGFPLMDYVKRFDSPSAAAKRADASGLPLPPSSKASLADLTVNGDASATVEDVLGATPDSRSDIMAELGRAAQWLQGKETDLS
jgi:hypothetical protein